VLLLACGLALCCLYAFIGIDPRIVEGGRRKFRKIWLGFVSHDLEVHVFIFKGHSWKV
jgi:hypothetical protein